MTARAALFTLTADGRTFTDAKEQREYDKETEAMADAAYARAVERVT